MEVVDPEGVTSDGKYFYIVGSQSKAAGLGWEGLVRFSFDPPHPKVEKIEAISGLNTFLEREVADLRSVDRRKRRNELNIEGLAWDPKNRRFLLGLRSPVINGQALVVPLKLKNLDGPFSSENLEVDGGKAIRLSINGNGVRSIEYDPQRDAFLIVAGSVGDENRNFRLLSWVDASSGPTLQELARFPSRLKPEGIARLSEGEHRTIMVFDTSHYLVN